MNEEVQVVGGADYANQTAVHPLGLLVLLVLGLCACFLPRRWSVWPYLILACFVPSAQRVVVAGLDFDFLRIMVLFGMVRLWLRNEYVSFVRKPLDMAVVAWVISSMLFYIVQQGTMNSVVNRLGFGFDALGMYFLFRCLVRDWRDVESLIFCVIIISIPIAICFFVENRTGRNMFAIFGGVPEMTAVREGRLRCQGAYSHAILAGCFWAAQMPLLAAYWWKSATGRIWAGLGMFTTCVIVFYCASSTPVMAIVFAVVGGLVFYLRRHLRIIRWGILLVLVLLHMVMKAPVWHLISRVSAVDGSTAWHRYNVINQAINHFGEWWLVGCSGLAVVSWGIFHGDVTNQYVLEGIRGGFLTLGLFVLVITIAFRDVGRLWRLQSQFPVRLAISWALGVSLFVHVMNFIGVAYFGQIWMIFYLLLAMIGSLAVRVSPGTVVLNGLPANVSKRQFPRRPLRRRL